MLSGMICKPVTRYWIQEYSTIKYQTPRENMPLQHPMRKPPSPSRGPHLHDELLDERHLQSLIDYDSTSTTVVRPRKAPPCLQPS